MKPLPNIHFKIGTVIDKDWVTTWIRYLKIVELIVWYLIAYWKVTLVKFWKKAYLCRYGGYILCLKFLPYCAPSALFFSMRKHLCREPKTKNFMQRWFQTTWQDLDVAWQWTSVVPDINLLPKKVSNLNRSKTNQNSSVILCKDESTIILYPPS